MSQSLLIGSVVMQVVRCAGRSEQRARETIAAGLLVQHSLRLNSNVYSGIVVANQNDRE